MRPYPELDQGQAKTSHSRRMRGEERRQRLMLMIMEPGDRVRREHPLRRVKELADAALAGLSPLFDEMCSAIGRPSIPPERLLKSSLLMALYTVRSERMFCEQLDYNLLFRWFLDMDVTEPSFDHSSFSRNRARLLEHDVAREFFTRVVAQAAGRGVGVAQELQAQGPETEPAARSGPGDGAKGRGRDRSAGEVVVFLDTGLVEC